ncbi:hypothetical protein [Stenomitos frigidus]|uniref:hypothetical protein n=1 Tax=Stenomitos frigidus TaxID=1886765 RepID=UPI0011B271F2|nr:hypothetical protein [Stenomitos frigidus]
MTIAGNRRAVPLEFRLDSARRRHTHGVASRLLACVAVLKWSWWHAKSYVPIAGLLLLALGSLVVLQGHWLYRRITHLPLRPKEVLKNVG